MLAPNFTYNARITNIVDGDTVDAVIDLGFSIHVTHRLRLLGLDTPELHDRNPEVRSRAVAARAFLQEALLGKQVVLTTRKSDSFGRYLAEVWYSQPMLDGALKSANEELLQLGYAVPFKG